MSYGGPPGAATLPGAPAPYVPGLGDHRRHLRRVFNIILGLPTALIGRSYGKRAGLWAAVAGRGPPSASRKARAWLMA